MDRPERRADGGAGGAGPFAEQAVAAAANRVVCRDQLRQGSRYVRQRLCRWQRQIGHAQGKAVRMTHEGGAMPLF